jgi:hypothetical protein
VVHSFVEVEKYKKELSLYILQYCSEWYQTNRYDFAYNRRCFLDTLRDTLMRTPEIGFMFLIFLKLKNKKSHFIQIIIIGIVVPHYS